MNLAIRHRRRSVARIAFPVLGAGLLAFGARPTDCAEVSCLAPPVAGETDERCARPHCVRRRFAWAKARVTSLYAHDRAPSLDL